MCFSPFIILSNATTQKRGCNTATCVTHRLADFLSRSGGLGHSNFVPTNVGAQAFGRRKRHSPVWATDEVHTHHCYKVWSISCNYVLLHKDINSFMFFAFLLSALGSTPTLVRQNGIIVKKVESRAYHHKHWQSSYFWMAARELPLFIVRMCFKPWSNSH